MSSFDFFLAFLRSGGPWMYAILGLGFLGFPLALAAGVLHGLGKRVPSFVFLSPVAGIACSGVLGSWLGSRMAREAAANAAPELQQSMLAFGISICLYTTAFAALLLMALGLLMAFSVAVGHLVSLRGERGKASLPAGLGALALVGLGMLVSGGLGGLKLASGMAGPWVLGGLVVGMLGLVCTGLVGLRVGVDEPGRDRSAGARFTAWSSLALAGWGAMCMPRVTDQILAFKAVAVAAPEHKSEMLRQGMEIAAANGWVGVGTLVGVLLAGLVLLLPLADAAGRNRGKTAVNGLMLVVTLGLILLAAGGVGNTRGLLDDLVAEEAQPETGGEPEGGYEWEGGAKGY